MAGAREDFVALAVEQYLTTALMVESCNGMSLGCDFGEDCDSSLWYHEYELECIAPAAREAAQSDVESFVSATWEVAQHYAPGDIGHDLWMTRTGEGVGFWDGTRAYASNRRNPGFRNDGQLLNDACKRLRHVDAYVGDDNLVHIA